MSQKKVSKKRKRVFVGLSGGVDSALAAALLLDRGYEVIPVFLKWWESAEVSGFRFQDSGVIACPWEEDQAAALSVAKRLGIEKEFRTWNFSREFFEDVLQPLIDEANVGRTGNPDIDCNRVVKFGAFLRRALEEGADLVATGHYARLRREGQNPKSKFQMLRAKCEAKNDQTYFLYQLTQEQLSKTLFPLGNFSSKEVVRGEARRRGLPTADRKSTRGICGIDKRNYPSGYAAFLGQYIPPHEGQVVTTTGRVVGTHEGVERYTYGQRKGIGVVDGQGPFYVVAKDQERNNLVVAGPAEAQRLLYQAEVVVEKAHWIEKVEFPLFCGAFIRHPQESLVPCNVTQQGADLHVVFAEPQFAPTPGQSIVFYGDDIVLGGGVMK